VTHQEPSDSLEKHDPKLICCGAEEFISLKSCTATKWGLPLVGGSGHLVDVHTALVATSAREVPHRTLVERPAIVGRRRREHVLLLDIHGASASCRCDPSRSPAT
jgi:hypothetical protein